MTRAQLLAAGVSSAAIDRAVAAGRVHRVHRGVYSAVAPGPLSEEGQLIAALQACGDGAMLSDGTAAWRWRLIAAPPSLIWLAVPRRRTVEGVRLHVSGRLRADDIERTLRRGHPGSANLRAALRAHVPGHGTTKSQLERRFRALLIRRGIELPLRNERIGSWTVDCLWPERRVVVELDGGQHDRPHQADVDRDRDLWLRAHGHVVLRYGDRQIDERPDDVIADLLDARGG